MTMQAYGYLRASTDRQDASVPAQKNAILEFARPNDVDVVQWFTDDGVSGKSFDRPNYRRMRALILGGNPDQVEHVIVWSLSRFGRVEPDDFIVERRELAKAGVTILSATEAIRGDGTLADGLLSYINAYQNREFLVKLSKDVTRGMRALVENGFWPSVAPLGYNRLVVDNQHKPIVVNDSPLILRRGELKGNQNHVILVPGEEQEQAAIRFMFGKRAHERLGLRRIAADLNEMGLQTIKAQPWKQSTVRSCLTNLTYIGHTRYGVRRKYKGVRNQIEGVELARNPREEWITVEDTHEALIPTDLFERVASTFCENGRRGQRTLGGRRKLMLFTSAIVCCRCGANYQCRPRKKNGRTYLYYECSGRTAGRTKDRCDSWSVNADKLRDFIFGEIQERVSTEEFQIALRAYLVGRLGQIIRSNVFDTRPLDREIAEFEGKKRRLFDAISDGLVERDDPQMAEKLGEINDRLLLLAARRREAERLMAAELNPDVIASQLIDRVRDLTVFLGSQDVEDQRKALFAFCKRIVADAGAREIVIETNLTGMACEEALPGVPAGLCNLNLPE
ncbi:MAG: recombinase family protein [Planctomycetes bacterium]|nr:recombinase family protein [Planctomycetota bacterium]